MIITNKLQMVIPLGILIHLHLHQIPLFSHFKILVLKSNQRLIPTLSSTLGWFSRGNASISLFAEHCLNEEKLPHCDTFNPRMKSSSKQSFIYILTNKHEAPTVWWHLVGGTGFTMSSLFCSQKLNHGGDSTGLGRWSFCRFQSKGSTTMCVFSAYCPVENPRNPGSVWNQHCRYFGDTRDDPNQNPRALFAEDLCRSISTRLTAGDSVSWV